MMVYSRFLISLSNPPDLRDHLACNERATHWSLSLYDEPDTAAVSRRLILPI